MDKRKCSMLQLKNTNKKPLLVFNGNSSFNTPSPHHSPLLEEFFTLEMYNETKNYPDGTTFVYRYKDSYEQIKHYNNGKNKFIVDSMWESHFNVDDNFDENTLALICNYAKEQKNIVKVPAWFWYEEHFSQQNKKPKTLPFAFDKTHSFLMQIGDDRPQRRNFYTDLQRLNLLQNAKYSFLEEGIALEGPVQNYDPLDPPFPQRHYEAEWYNKTNFTVVVETDIDLPGVFLTEKTFKPIMYGHPFIIYGQPGSLELLKSLGFKTFNNIFDESYDTITDTNERRQKIVEQIQKMPTAHCKEIVQHNFELFWNREIVNQKIIKDIIKPILDFINAEH